MTSGVFGSCSPSSITINRAERTRAEVTETAVTDMLDSMNRLGQIHPIVITKDFVLVAGETRLTAALRGGWTSISYQFAEDLPEDELLSIELEENLKRTDLPWQDRVAGVKRYHELQASRTEGWRLEDTGKALGLTVSSISYLINVANEAEANPKIRDQKKYSVAKNMAARATSRRKDDEVNAAGILTPTPAREASPILVADFNEWAPSYSGAPFNLIHCDFPYGIGFDAPKFGSYDTEGSYEDGEDVYWKLIETLCNEKERLLGSSGHVLFWFSMKHYQSTLDSLRKHFLVNEFPLIWHKSCNTGTLSDASRWPRRVYETAFLVSHGDRKIIQAVANTFSGPVIKTAGHVSEKSPDMLAHFFRMFVDERTRLLDPTCGSGSALRAGDKLRAGYVLGLEKNEEFAADAAKAWDLRK